MVNYQQKADELYQSWMNGNRKDVLTYLQGQTPERAALLTIGITNNFVTFRKDATYQVNLFVQLLGGNYENFGPPEVCADPYWQGYNDGLDAIPNVAIPAKYKDVADQNAYVRGYNQGYKEQSEDY